jgi:hypothetical protein
MEDYFCQTTNLETLGEQRLMIPRNQPIELLGNEDRRFPGHITRPSMKLDTYRLALTDTDTLAFVLMDTDTSG